MKELGISREVMDQSYVGWADRSLGRQLPANTVLAGRIIRSRLTELGIYKPNGRETLRGCVTIPLVDIDGNMTGIEGFRMGLSQRSAGTIRIGTGERIAADETIEVRQVVNIEPTSDMHKVPVNDQPAASESSNLAECSPLNEHRLALEQTAAHTSNDDFSITIQPHGILIARGDRSYLVRGLDRNMSSLSLKVNVTASRLDAVHVDTVDLLKASSRTAFIRAASTELYCSEETIKKDLGILLLQLDDLRNRQIEAAKGLTKPMIKMTEADEHDALELLRDPNLASRIIEELNHCGMVGEPINKLVAYLAVTSRKLARPLAVLVRSNSSAGKTTLMDSVLGLIPPDEQLRLSNLTSHSLYYLDTHALSHKVLAVSEDQGIEQAAYALKLLQSEGRLTHATVAKGPTGDFQVRSHHVEGPVQLFLTSTQTQLDEELVNRCVILTVDESPEQTRAIHAAQRRMQTRSGKDALTERMRIQTVHQNAQRLIRPVEVDNPFAESLQFASERTRFRRDHEKYLTLIAAIALLHQHQRPILTDDQGRERIEVTQADIELADRLMARLLKQSIDELTPQTQRCLELLRAYVASLSNTARASDVRFTRRALRESIQWSDYQVATHLQRLVNLEYVRAHRGKQGATYVYELLD